MNEHRRGWRALVAACVTPPSGAAQLQVLDMRVWDVSVLSWKMADDDAEVDVWCAFSGIRLIWRYPKTGPFGKKKKKSITTHTIPPTPPPSFSSPHKSNLYFRGENNSGSSPTILWAQLGQHVTGLFIPVSMITEWFYLFICFSLTVADVCGAAPGGGRGMTSTMESGSFI